VGVTSSKDLQVKIFPGKNKPSLVITKTEKKKTITKVGVEKSGFEDKGE